MGAATVSSLARRRAPEGDRVLSLASELLRRAGALGRGMAAHLHEHIPELDNGDPEQFDETRASCEANIAQVLRLLKRGERPDALVTPPEACDFVNGMVRRGLPLAVLLRSYRLGHQWLGGIWAERLVGPLGPDPPRARRAPRPA